MAPTYYVIELTARWLTALLVMLALVMVLAFAFGYGAAWSVLSGGRAAAPTPLPVVAATTTPTVVPTPPPPTARPTARPTEKPSERPATPTRVATATPAQPATDEFWVQVLASSTRETAERAQKQLEELGFARSHQRVDSAQVAGGDALYKVRVGPFPDRESADRVVKRMQASGFPDAWIVTP